MQYIRYTAMSMNVAYERFTRTMAAYPAVIAGFILYGQFLLSAYDLYVSAQHTVPGLMQSLKFFLPLVWMWGVAFALAAVMDMRERRHASEREGLRRAYDAEMEQARLKALRETVVTLQHEINNPLAVIYLHLHVLKRHAYTEQELTQCVKEIDGSSRRIQRVIAGLSGAERYRTAASPAGNLIRIMGKN